MDNNSYSINNMYDEISFAGYENCQKEAPLPDQHVKVPVANLLPNGARDEYRQPQMSPLVVDTQSVYVSEIFNILYFVANRR